MTKTFLSLFIIASVFGCKEPYKNPSNSYQTNSKDSTMNFSIATFGAGCFWCVEAVFQRLNGVEKVTSGYAGGRTKNPTYQEVCEGNTGHAEVCQILYDSAVISYEELVEVFFTTHDPTTINRQGNDVGTQYRSAIFFGTEKEKEIAIGVKQKFTSEKIFENPIVTEITKLSEFYPAENYHQNYYNNNSYQPYCMFVINPKIEKLRKKYRDKLKPEALK